MRALPVLFTTAALLSGCTKWGTIQVDGPRHEVERRMLGSPSVATTSSKSMSAGFAGARGNGVAVAGLEGSTDSISRTHCVQQAEIYYEQPFELHPVPKGRVNDVAGAVLLGFLGLSVMVAAKISSSTIFEPGDPLYEEPPSPVPGYLIGGAMIGGGVGLLAYSFGSLPKGPKPQVLASKRNWMEVGLVESTGCGLPGDPGIAQRAQPQPVIQPQPQPQPVLQPQPQPVAQPQPQPVVQPRPAAAQPAQGDAAVRLKKLDDLRASGAITEAEYQKKRKQIIEAI